MGVVDNAINHGGNVLAEADYDATAWQLIGA
jgi:hypothetical protein